jgi:uncharacterized protein YutE (UPF0331/DUF86 family)
VTQFDLVTRKLGVLVDHVGRARRRRPADAATFGTDVDVQDALGMSLLVATQEAIDIAFHVAAEEGWGLPSSSAESFEMLAQHGVIDASLANELGRVTRVRNRIAHGYASIDAERLWHELPVGLDALDAFAAQVARHLDGP